MQRNSSFDTLYIIPTIDVYTCGESHKEYDMYGHGLLEQVSHIYVMFS